MEVEGSTGQWERLLEVLARTPGPTPWYTPAYPSVDGPSGTKLNWVYQASPLWVSALVPEGRTAPAYLGLGFHCWAGKLAANRLMVWRHVGKHAKPMHWDYVRISMFGTSELEPIDWSPDTERDDPVGYTAGLLAEVDLPTGWERGRHRFEFPEVFEGVPETIILVTVYNSQHELEEALYFVRPMDDVVEVVPLDWWNKGDFDFAYEWISKVGRDTETGRLFGTGFRIRSFVMKDTGEFIEWIKQPPGWKGPGP